MDHKLDKDYLEQLILEKKLLGLNEKLLVVGGTGFIGYHLLREAKKRKYQLFSISLNKPKKIRNILGVKYIFADISKYKVLKTKLNISFDYVINAGGYGNHPEFGEWRFIDKKSLSRSHKPS